MVKSSTKKVVIDKPSMARDIPTSLCDLPQAVRDGIVNVGIQNPSPFHLINVVGT